MTDQNQERATYILLAIVVSVLVGICWRWLDEKKQCEKIGGVFLGREWICIDAKFIKK